MSTHTRYNVVKETTDVWRENSCDFKPWFSARTSVFISHVNIGFLSSLAYSFFKYSIPLTLSLQLLNLPLPTLDATLPSQAGLESYLFRGHTSKGSAATQGTSFGEGGEVPNGTNIFLGVLVEGSLVGVGSAILEVGCVGSVGSSANCQFYGLNQPTDYFVNRAPTVLVFVRFKTN
jgi:hypothetical protein